MVNYVTEAVFAVHILSKRLASTTKADMKRLKHFGRYLIGVKDMALYFPKAGDIETLECYSDSDWAGDACDRKSVACGIIQCGGCTLLEYARGQLCHALSSGEAEYYGGVSCAAEGLHMQSVLGFLGMPTRIRLRLDSSAAKAVCQRTGVGRIRHLEVRTLWLQQKVKEKRIAVCKQDGDTNVADIGTKSLAGPRFAWMREQIGRVRLGNGPEVPESKAVRVNIVTKVDDMQKIGIALMALFECMTGVRAGTGECDGGLARHSPSSSDEDFWNSLVICLALGMMLSLGIAIGVGYARCTMPSPTTPLALEASAAPASTTRMSTKTTRSLGTQSQCTYRWKNQTPRFVPLGELAQGAFCE
jgi:hypothetical protein